MSHSLRRSAAPVAALVGAGLYGGFVGLGLTRQARAGIPAIDSGDVTFAVTFLAFVLAGAYLGWRRPTVAVGWLMAGAGLAMLATSFFSELGVRDRPSAAWVSTWMWAVGQACATLMIMLLPSGQWLSPRWRRIAVVPPLGAVLAIVGSVSLWGMTSEQLTAQTEPPSPFAIAGALLLMLSLLAGAVSLILRFRASRGEERLQLKWIVLAVVAVVVAFAINQITGRVFGLEHGLTELTEDLLNVVTLGIPAAIAAAVLRYRLYEIDLIINRSLVYAIAGVIVIAIYVAVVGLLSLMISRRADTVSALVATAVVAVIFAPLRDRVQAAMSRTMFGDRDDPYRALSRLQRLGEAALPAHEILPSVAEAIAAALRLPYVEVRLDDSHGNGLASAAHGTSVGSDTAFPLVHRGDRLGTMIAGARSPSERFSPRDVAVLEDLAGQAAAAAHSLRLMMDLQRSRERIVVAREEERKRLRHDLHDGVGPTLAAITLGIDAAAAATNGDAETRGRLEALREQSRDAISDIRRLVVGLRPPALDEMGLAGALRELSSRLSSPALAVNVSAGALPPLPAAVEVAAYRIASEAILNAVRHAGATRCDVTIRADGDLMIEVTDDGAGIDPSKPRGEGLDSMRDRAEELGGSVAVEDAPGGGTQVAARIPIPLAR